ncbi:MAG: four helix bundle suffix domain-containing protein [Puniceicoccales bacterium]
MELFRKSAGYRFMDSFVLAQIVELGTRHFCNAFLNLKNDPGGRTFSQMTHAARSGSRNYAEGSERLQTSFSSGLDLLNVARASLCELRDDYNEWLMLRGQAPWPKDSQQAMRIYAVRLDPPNYGDDINRGVCLHILAQYRNFEPELSSSDSLVRANALLILIGRTLHTMSRYLERLGQEFTKSGGFKERLTEVRTEARAMQHAPPADGPKCPLCGSPTRLRKTRKDNRPFWGCTDYPGCRGVVNYHAANAKR